MDNMSKFLNISKHFFCIVIGIVLFCNFASAQEVEITPVTGIINDSDGLPVENVNVSVIDEFMQTFTGADGKFEIIVPKGKALYFNKTGYIPQTKKAEELKAELEILLSPSQNEEIIAVAYGTRKKSELTHSISVISADDLEKEPVINLSKAIAGKANGLTVLKNTGDEPGYDYSSLFVRGIGTFGSYRTPLVMVDNVERDFTQLDPVEIESFTVLKDAAATANYGIRGANGVVSVLTKRGFVGKPVIHFMAQSGFQTPALLPEFLGSKEFVTLYNKALTNDGLAIPGDDRYNPEKYNGSDTYKYPDVDWYKEFVKASAPQQQYKLTLRGGTDVVRYFVFLGAANQDGLTKHTEENAEFSTNQKYVRYNVRSNIDININKDFLISVDLAGRVENRHFPNVSASSLFSTLSQLPPNAMPITNRDGSLAGTSVYRNNPLGMISKTGYRDNFQRFLSGNVSGNYKLDSWVKGLSANMFFGFDANNYYSVGKSQSYAVYQEYTQNDTVKYSKYGENTDISLNNSKFDDGFNLQTTLLGGLSYNNTFGNSSLDADLKYMQSKSTQKGNEIAYANQGMFGRMTYGINQRYFAEFGFAYNGSEDFKKGNRFGFFPTISAAWLLSNENFLKDNSVISFLKIRSSYGIVGNGKLGVDRFTYEQKYYGWGGYIFDLGYGSSDGSYEGRIANPDVTWEKSAVLNVGLDLCLMNAFELSFDVFNSDRTDIITDRYYTLPSIIGQSMPYENIGSVLNKGFELTLGYHKKTGKVNFFAQANLSYSNNEITNKEEPQGLPSYQYNKGKSVTTVWGLESLGFFSDEADIANSPYQSYGSVKPGDVKYKDQNGDNVIDDQDNIAIGNSMPKWNYGIMAGVSFKGFDFNLILNGIQGRTILLQNSTVWVIQNNNKATSIAYQAWEKGVNESTAKYPRLTTMNNPNNYRASTLWTEKGDFLKLSNLEIGYSFPRSLTNRLKMSELRIFVNGYNLLSFDTLKDFNLDAEVPNAGVTMYPSMRVFNAGISIKF